MTTDNFPAKELRVKLDGGLGNRIRPALSALFMGYKLNIPVAFSWEITRSCQCPVEMLFENRLRWMRQAGSYLRYSPADSEAEAALATALRTQQVLRLKSSVYYEAFHRQFPGEAEVWIAENFDQYFVPKRNLRKIITQFTAHNNLQNALGVHVRRGDRVGSRSLPCLYQYAPLIDQPQHRHRTIFLTTDDSSCESNISVTGQFLSRYGERVVYRPKRSVGRDLLGMQDALIDLWLLRACHSIIGVKMSTFSETAAIGRKAVLL
jgi:hypothetical protein